MPSPTLKTKPCLLDLTTQQSCIMDEKMLSKMQRFLPEAFERAAQNGLREIRETVAALHTCAVEGETLDLHEAKQVAHNITLFRVVGVNCVVFEPGTHLDVLHMLASLMWPRLAIYTVLMRRTKGDLTHYVQSLDLLRMTDEDLVHTKQSDIRQHPFPVKLVSERSSRKQMLDMVGQFKPGAATLVPQG